MKKAERAIKVPAEQSVPLDLKVLQVKSVPQVPEVPRALQENRELKEE